MEDVRFNHPGSAAEALRQRAGLMGSRTMDVANVDFLLPHQIGKVGRLGDDPDTGASQLIGSHAASQTPADEHFESGFVQILTKYLKRLFRAAELEPVRHVEHPNLRHIITLP
jgi:hypothetical protein